MNIEKLKPLVKGVLKNLPGIKKLLPSRTGHTDESRYCYVVWMSHLKNWRAHNDGPPETVAELGPGDTLGIGLAALLSGSSRLFALDVVKYWNARRNLKIFEELVGLFKNKAPVPDSTDDPDLPPESDNDRFPSHSISDRVLSESLSEKRLNAIRKEILDIDNTGNSFIKYYIPWNDANIMSPAAVDFIYSQAVLEHVDNLDAAYGAMRKWLKPSGFMSHNIDFRSHGITKCWNGHWTFSDFEWKIAKGGSVYFLNRQPCSKHIELHSKHGFSIAILKKTKIENTLNRREIAPPFKTLSEEDITTGAVYILSKKAMTFRSATNKRAAAY